MYKGKYRRQTIRLKNWDYTQNAKYFVTICTKDRRHFFGQVVRGEMELSDLGKIVYEEWEKTFQIRPYIHRDEFIVMPNHVHMMVWIGHGRGIGSRCGDDCVHGQTTDCGETCVGGYGEAAPRRYGDGIPPKPDSLGSIIGSYKSACTRRIRESGHAGFSWQDNYWENIVRDVKSYARIINYIQKNPENWTGDRFYYDPCG